MIDMDIGNYRGNLHIKELSGKYFWAVECDLYNEDEWEWKEIPRKLYKVLIEFKKDMPN